MKNYLTEQPAGKIIRHSLEIYLSNFKTLSLIFSLPILLSLLLSVYTKEIDQKPLIMIAEAIKLFTVVFASLAVVIAVSDISLGRRPTVGRSYRCAYRKGMGTILVTYLLLGLVLLVGFILLVVPGILFSLWYVLTLEVVLLERLSGWKALKRSKELGKGFYWRNWGVMILMCIIYIASVVISSYILGLTVSFIGHSFGLGSPEFLNLKQIGSFIAESFALLFYPIMAIVSILIYYDMRVRKEAYGIRELTEDLAR
ncbi:hypothetical protein [Candidatus Nitrotoga arctica]|uniref:Glycerophosphoryl diester phosphodiesterase membrane domain-containing protein n=1 Tax=Candidatus Nitrotoga arctica TaxID=453162 RepID=A0ABM8YX05_9PROT|nr:hypothetical protein [Candidatus Nitrotoga arctica]CAG9932042.1 conserved membrane protein of unknown function [Candidatus Nitrotoga arctica]